MAETNILPLLMGADVAGGLAGSYAESEGIRSRDRIQRAQADVTRRRLLLQARDASNRGEREAQVVEADTRQLRGAQRAAYAAQGVDLGSGSPDLIQAETEAFGAEDAAAIRGNAWREAWGIRSEAENVALESRWESKEARRQRRQTLVVGGLRALSGGARTAMVARSSDRGPSNPTVSRFDSDYRRDVYGTRGRRGR
jgi:hypothetical protein